MRTSYLILILALFSTCSATKKGGKLDDIDKSFTIVAFPDTQMYAKDDPTFRSTSRKEIFSAMTNWVVERSKPDNIKFVLHMGDIVNEDYEPYQWENANKAMSILDGVVPYCFAVGNHDMVLDSTRNTVNFNSTFPYTRYKSEKWYGGRMKDDGYSPGDNYDNSYHFFSGGGMEFMVVSLECGPTDTMIEWANEVIAKNSDKRVIVITHSYMLGNDTRDKTTDYLPPSPPSNSGEMLWQKLIRKHANIFLVVSGHHKSSDGHKGLLTSKGIHGNTVYQLLNGDWWDGWLRVFKFKPNQNKIVVKSYSPWKPEDIKHQWREYDFILPNYNKDQFHEYELDYLMLVN